MVTPYVDVMESAGAVNICVMIVTALDIIERNVTVTFEAQPSKLVG